MDANSFLGGGLHWLGVLASRDLYRSLGEIDLLTQRLAFISAN